MINIVVLQDTLNPISAQERVKINENWDALRRGFSSLQNQINFLSGGTEVDVIVARIEQAIQDAQTNTQTAIDNVNNNYAEKLVEINQSLTDLSTALTNAQAATNEANAARDNATNATNSALAAIAEIQNVISNFSPRGDFVLGTQYYKSNIVSNGQGSSYIAIRDNINSPLTNTTSWMLLASIGKQGIQGERGETGRGFEVKGYFATIQDLENAVSSPQAGDAYGVGSAEPYDIYIYDGVNNVWVNNGALQGAKGDTGPTGPQGPQGIPGETQDLTPIQTQLDNHESRISVLENQEVTVKADVSGLNREVAYLKLQQQASERIEGGTVFADDFNGSRFGFELKVAKTESTVPLVQGETILTGKIETVKDGSFTVGSQVTVVDGENSETVEITRSELVDASETFVATNEVVIASAYSTAGNGGRKIVRLDNGWLIAGVINASKNIDLYKSDNDGITWSILTQNMTANTTYIALAAVGNDIKVCFANVGNFRIFRVSPSGEYLPSTLIDTAQTADSVLSASLVYDKATNTLHAAWSSKNSTYPNSFNIRYANSMNEGETWSVAEQITTNNVGTINSFKPSLTLDANGNPVVTYAYTNGANGFINRSNYNGTSWNATSVIYAGGSHSQDNPSSTLSDNGVIHLAWNGFDLEASTASYIRYSNSADGVVWSNMQKLVIGTNPSIATDKNGHIFITYENAGSTYYIKSTDDGENWSVPVLIGVGTNPSTLVDNSLVYTVPPTVQMTATNIVFNGTWLAPFEVYNLEVSPLANSYNVGTFIGESSINTNGSFLTFGSTPARNATLTYIIPSTDYVGAFVKKAGNLTIQGYLNDQLMTSELNVDEYTFEGQLSVASQATLRLELSRTDTSNGNGDRLTRILGGRS